MTQWQDVLNWAAGSTRANGSCQGFAGNDFTSAFGHFGYGYASANAAMAASKAAGTFHTGLPPANQVVWVFFAFPTYGHVMLYYNGVCLGDSSQCTAWLNAKRTVGTMPWGHYSYPYLGWASTNGVNTVPVIPTPNVNPYGNAGAQITVLANRRSAPTTGSSVLDQRAVGAWVKLDGYCSEGQAVSGNTTWYHDSIGGWYSATVATAVAPATLARLGTDGKPWVAPPPAPPASFTVTFDFLDGEQSVTESVAPKAVIAAPPIPTNSGYTFKEWTTDAAGADPWDVTTPVVTDITLYAQWEHVPVQPEPPTVEPPVVPPVTPTPPANNPPAKPVDQWGWVTIALQAVGKFLQQVLANMFKPPKL